MMAVLADLRLCELHIWLIYPSYQSRLAAHVREMVGVLCTIDPQTFVNKHGRKIHEIKGFPNHFIERSRS